MCHTAETAPFSWPASGIAKLLSALGHSIAGDVLGNSVGQRTSENPIVEALLAALKPLPAAGLGSRRSPGSRWPPFAPVAVVLLNAKYRS